jgi:hypothetical protein
MNMKDVPWQLLAGVSQHRKQQAEDPSELQAERVKIPWRSAAAPIMK